MRCYRTLFSREALDFATRANAAGFGEIEFWVDQIEQAPARRGDYVERDDEGRELQVIVLHTLAITYWADDAAREVRVVAIEAL